MTAAYRGWNLYVFHYLIKMSLLSIRIDRFSAFYVNMALTIMLPIHENRASSHLAQGVYQFPFQQ